MIFCSYNDSLPHLQTLNQGLTGENGIRLFSRLAAAWGGPVFYNRWPALTARRLRR
jgi:hypothetical protein